MCVLPFQTFDQPLCAQLCWRSKVSFWGPLCSLSDRDTEKCGQAENQCEQGVFPDDWLSLHRNKTLFSFYSLLFSFHGCIDRMEADLFPFFVLKHKDTVIFIYRSY